MAAGRRTWAGILLAAAIGAAPCASWAQSIPAFSGADGPGSTATGGRGGDVYHVTRLDADKDGLLQGSLQYGINTAPSAGRTIVFDVGGTIYLAGQTANDTLRYSKSNITIAGQTAPGPGITIAGTGTKWTGTNVILRNISIRPNKAPVTYDAFSLQTKNSIIDHVSATWFTDEGISITDAGENTTIQYSNISEGLNYAGHSFGSIIATERDGTQYSFNHNLYAHNASRMPRVGSEIGQTGAVLSFTNNVLYNWSSTKVGYGGENQPGSTNFINNYYVKGYNNNTENLFVGDDNPENSGVTKVYESGNKLDGNRNGVIDGIGVGGKTYFRSGLTLYGQPFNVSGVSTPDSADVALQRTLDYGGANWWNRSPIDARIADSVRTGTGQNVNEITAAPQTAEWATLMSQRPNAQGEPPGKREAAWDADGDGMPGEWELAHGLNPNVADHNGDFDGDGYRNVEEYINEIAEWPAPAPIVFNGATNNRYAQITNWNIKWQPSKFDEAQINAGTVVVDAVGQHAKTLKIATSSSDVAQLNVASGWLVAATSVVIGATPTAQGTLNLSGGALVTPTLTKGDAGAVNFTGGMLSAGTVTFDLVNNGGAISPGASPGTTRVMGDLTINSGSMLLELAGDGNGQYDRVIVDDALAAGGTLEVSLLGGYAPALDDSFDLLDFASVSGSFALNLPALDPGLAWDASELMTLGTLSVVDASTDFDRDGDIDGADFLSWQAGFGREGPDNDLNGDANGDDMVDGLDLADWQAQFIQGSTGAGQGVPEPASWVATVCAVAMSLGARRQLAGSSK